MKELVGLLILLLLSNDTSKPKTTLRVSPQVAFAPIVATIMLLVIKPTVEMYCAERTWDLGDNRVEIHAADCDPYGPVPDRWVEYKEVIYRSPGEYPINVWLKYQGKTVGTGHTTLTLR